MIVMWLEDGTSVEVSVEELEELLKDITFQFPEDMKEGEVYRLLDVTKKDEVRRLPKTTPVSEMELEEEREFQFQKEETR